MSIRRAGAPGSATLPALLLAAACLLAGCGGGARSTPSAVFLTTATTPHGGGLVARGAALYQEDGCSGCHTLNGTRAVGPSWKGLAGSTVTLASGRRVIADNAYLVKHIVDPDALTVRGYPAGVMAQAIEALHLRRHPSEVRALTAFIDSLR
ncbi:MAG TPA: cytochrome c [Solirubrobacteraceae bacterium]|jgi:mono/diheme cytochrome c family protein|nr:cytochrome c [Solirubrobacteraceae bacterium]